MSTHPYLPLYVDDYEAATAHLSIEEDGVYSRLIRLCWRTPGCSLPNDPAWIARKVRLSPEDFARIAEPVIAEFFKLQRGRLVQRRLKREYDNISRKKSARKSAGKKGGEAKARNEHDKQPSNASGLLGDTRAFPEPEPEPQERGIQDPSLSGDKPPRASKASKRKPETAIPEGFPDADAMAWAQGERRKAGTVLDVDSHAKRFRNHALTKDRRERDWNAAWANWVEIEIGKAPKANDAAPAVPLAPWPGPAEIRAAIVLPKGEAWAVSYLDRCAWRDVPSRAVVTSNGFIADTLRKEAGAILSGFDVRVLVEPQAERKAS
jgi:uncharacterized protein YdaU (DUF1376 family)